VKVDQSVIAVLDAATVDGPSLRLNGQLDRKLYTAVAKALEVAGGKWNRKAGAHLFEGEAAEAIEPIILTGEIVSAKREFDAFFTPKALAQHVCALAGVAPGSLVLEPSAGAGAIAKAATALGGEVSCVELQDRLAAQLEADGFNVIGRDFLQVPPEPFDIVVMNPPFSRQQDIRHVMHAAQFLLPGGRLVAIMSASVAFRDNALTRDFRDWLSDGDGTITHLPDGSFKESGTSVSTVIVSYRAAGAGVSV
jgi:predicted RNA methylase